MEDFFQKYERSRQARIRNGTHCSDLSVVFTNLQRSILETRDLNNYNTPENCRDRLKKVKNILPNLPLATGATSSSTLSTLSKFATLPNSTKTRYPNARPCKLEFESSEAEEGGEEAGESPPTSGQQDELANSLDSQHYKEVVDLDFDFTCDPTFAADADDNADKNESIPIPLDCIKINGISVLEFDPDIELRNELYDYSCLSKELRTCFIGIVKEIFQNEMRIQGRLPLFKKFRIKNNSSNSNPNKTSILLKDIDLFFERPQLADFSKDFEFNWAKKERYHATNQGNPVKNSVEHSSTNHVADWSCQAGDERS